MLWSAFLCLCIASTTGKLSNKPKVVVISLGGYRHEILSNENSHIYAPNIKWLQNNWARPNFMMPVYPTKGTTNHISIATGYYAEDHGVLDDCIYDEPRDKCEFGVKNTTKLPIWIENQLQDGISGVIDWPGSEKEYDGQKAHYNKNYTRYEGYSVQNDQNDYMNRITTIMTWLTNKDNPANLVMVYYNVLDKVLHENPVHKKDPSYVQIELADMFVGKFMEVLKFKEIDDHINVIILGSHGVIDVNEIDGLHLPALLNENSTYVSMGSYAIITPHSGKFDEVNDLLEKNAQINGEVCYYIYKTTNSIPTEWHLKGSPLIERKILVVAHYTHFFWNEYLEYIRSKKYGHLRFPFRIFKTSKKNFEACISGYPLESGVDEYLKTIFMAKGPRIRPGKEVREFKTIDVYPLLRELLGLPKSEKQKKRLEEMNDAVQGLLYLP